MSGLIVGVLKNKKLKYHNGRISRPVKYLGGIPEGSRATQGKSLNPQLLSDDVIRRLNGLNDIASARGQTLAQMAIAWVLKAGRVTTALIGASKVSQIEDCVGALGNTGFSDAELATIEELSLDGNLINLWARSSEEV